MAIGHGQDSELCARIRAGDASAFDEWYRRDYPAAWRFALRYVNARDDATDIAQDFFLHIWRNRSSLQINGALLPYVLGAIRHRALTMLRHSKVEEAMELSAEHPGMSTAPALPDLSTDEALLREQIRRKMDNLPDRQRSALILRWDYGLSNAEIAKVLEIGEAAASRLLSRATDALREGCKL